MTHSQINHDVGSLPQIINALTQLGERVRSTSARAENADSVMALSGEVSELRRHLAIIESILVLEALRNNAPRA